MKYIIVYYSRTGHTKTIGMAIGKALSADIDEISDKKKLRWRFWSKIVQLISRGELEETIILSSAMVPPCR